MALFLARGTADDPALAAAARQFARTGLPAPVPLSRAGWSGLHSGYAANPLATFHADGDDWIAVAGTLVHDGRMGTPALAALLASFGEAPDWSRLAGQFACAVHRRGRTCLFTDWLGAFPLYHEAERRLFSTSFLALLGAMPAVRFDAQGVWEYAFNIAPLGDDTVIDGVRTLGPGELVELTPDGTRSHPLPKPLPKALPRGVAAMPSAERIERTRAAFAAAVAPAAAFPRVHCPLSGGLDSRLVLAALRAAGVDPCVYVYGDADSTDVRVARGIGAALSFPVEWRDKRSVLPDPDAFPALVEAEFHLLDGPPNYGNIFDNGGNAGAMAARHAGGGLAVSGGGGEVLRDFFYLSDRPTSARDLARAFWSRFAAADAAAGFDSRRFMDGIAAKIAAALDARPDEAVPRAVAEAAYPRIRCRSLFGREAGVEARIGPYLLPFLDHRVVAEGARLPMREKRAGRFEAQLLATIDPALARQPSAYGHDFAAPPSLAHRRAEWAARMRPLWMRERGYAVRRRLARLGDDHGGLMGSDYLPRVVDSDLPLMRAFFAVDRVRDPALARRIAALEYLGAWLGGRLRG